MSKPMTKREVRRAAQQRTDAIEAAGIQWVEVLGCNHPPDECDAYRAIQGKRFRIEDAPTLPLPGCDKKHCKCIILACDEPDETTDDLTVSMPAGCEQVSDDERPPRVRLSELRRGPMGRPLGGNEPAWLKWLVIALLVLILVPGVFWVLGIWGVLILIGLATVALLAGIFVRLGKR